jgi:UDP-glucose 4-epimerase
VAQICGTHLVPLSPYSPLKLRPLSRLFDLPVELEDLLRYGRGVDTRRFATTGFDYRATSAGAVQSFIRSLRLRRGVGKVPPSYTYEHDVEQFFRHSPSVQGVSDS